MLARGSRPAQREKRVTSPECSFPLTSRAARRRRPTPPPDTIAKKMASPRSFCAALRTASPSDGARARGAGGAASRAGEEGRRAEGAARQEVAVARASDAGAGGPEAPQRRRWARAAGGAWPGRAPTQTPRRGTRNGRKILAMPGGFLAPSSPRRQAMPQRSCSGVTSRWHRVTHRPWQALWFALLLMSAVSFAPPTAAAEPLKSIGSIHAQVAGFSASLFKFQTIVEDDGKDSAGGWQRTNAILGFSDGRGNIVHNRRFRRSDGQADELATGAFLYRIR
jgi:hypothetical protein